ncbi:discoidin domain-containing protein [Paenibacillus sp. sgz302251]|uniref:discoidin domain-containing protein n=1 Tax=Paenibacillus sp. sgz302251 TaxID=3414493 RepID=UPI003C7E52CE
MRLRKAILLFLTIVIVCITISIQITPRVSAAPINLAYGKTVFVSSTESPSYAASYAVDANGNTRWSSAYADQQYITVDLGSLQTVSSVRINWEAAYARQFQVQVSLDNSSWSTVYSNYNATGDLQTINFSSTTARYVKIYLIQRASSYGFSLWEFEIYNTNPDAPVNLAYNKSVSVSSTENGSYSAGNAVDANGNTRWSSSYADNQFITVDLGSAQTVSRVVLKWEAAYARQYQVQISSNNSTWTTVYSNYDAAGGNQTIDFAPAVARYVKVYLIQRATSYGFSLWEFEIYNNGNGGGGAAIGVLDYLKGVGRSGTIIGHHNREPNSNPSYYTNQMYNITGKYPALWSGDFLFAQSDVDHRWTMIYEVERQWNNGALINIMLHVTNPKQGEVGSWNGGVVSDLTDAEWNSLITNGGSLNTAWKNRLNTYAAYLQYLEDRNVPVLFRPFHEMNQGIFWWAGRPGPNGTAALYRLTHDYLVNTKGLSNLIWVWDMQDLAPPSGQTFASDWASYNPGNSYWDVFAVDIYEGLTTAKYNAAIAVAGDKPIAIGEFAKMPTPSQLQQMPRWAFAMGWAEWVYAVVPGQNNNQPFNTTAEIQATYNASNVITLDELPDLQ